MAFKNDHTENAWILFLSHYNNSYSIKWISLFKIIVISHFVVIVVFVCQFISILLHSMLKKMKVKTDEYINHFVHCWLKRDACSSIKYSIFNYVFKLFCSKQSNQSNMCSFGILCYLNWNVTTEYVNLIIFLFCIDLNTIIISLSSLTPPCLFGLPNETKNNYLELKSYHKWKWLSLILLLLYFVVQ